MSLFETLEARGLLARESLPATLPDVDTPATLLCLCSEGALVGGLSVALDVRPDELFGPLCTAVGGRALAIKVEDVRDDPPELTLSLGGERKVLAVPELRSLVDALNAWLARDARARWIAVLGEQDDALALFCVPKSSLPVLRRLRAFSPENA